jgi:hypothetical protein
MMFPRGWLLAYQTIRCPPPWLELLELEQLLEEDHPIEDAAAAAAKEEETNRRREEENCGNRRTTFSQRTLVRLHHRWPPRDSPAAESSNNRKCGFRVFNFQQKIFKMSF